MKTKEILTTRQQAIDWWNNLSHNIRQILCNRHITFAEMQGRMQNTLTGREIEEIYDKEVLEFKRQEEWQESQVN